MRLGINCLSFLFICAVAQILSLPVLAQTASPVVADSETANQTEDFDMKISESVSPHQTVSNSNTTESDSKSEPGGSLLDRVKWGNSFITIGASKLSYTDSALKNVYGELYGNFPTGPSFGAEMIVWRRLISLGLRLEAAYFTDSGFPASKSSSYNKENSTGSITPLKDEKTEFTVVPIDAGLWLRFPIWQTKPIFVSAGGGVSRILHTETRIEAGASEGGSTGKPSVNQGIKTNNFFGAELGIRITGSGFGTEGLSADALNLKAIYLCGFYRSSVDQSKSGMDLSSTMLGVNFGFELF